MSETLSYRASDSLFLRDRPLSAHACCSRKWRSCSPRLFVYPMPLTATAPLAELLEPTGSAVQHERIAGMNPRVPGWRADIGPVLAADSGDGHTFLVQAASMASPVEPVYQPSIIAERAARHRNHCAWP
jgi:hypothetical protein